MIDELDIDTGQLRQRVALQSLTETADAYGQLQPSWATTGTYWAQVRSPTGRELVNAQQLKAVASHVLVMRWNPDIVVSPTLRFLLGTRVFNIAAVINVQERNIKMLVYCTEQVTPAES